MLLSYRFRLPASLSFKTSDCSRPIAPFRLFAADRAWRLVLALGSIGLAGPLPAATESTSVAVTATNAIVDVRSFGAIGDGVTFDTKAIQAAIDACALAKGGRVLLPPGTYLTRTIYLKSNVTLYLEAGSVLLGGPTRDDYDLNVPGYKAYTYGNHDLIHAENAENVSILGKGAIDLQGRNFRAQTKDEPGQMEWGRSPFGLRLVKCNNLTIRDVTVRNCPMVALRVEGSENVLIDGVIIENNVRISCDGIEIVSCREVVIANCRVNSWDDGICLKSANYEPCRNITITNCTISSSCNSIKLGTESNGGFQNIAISNCTIELRQTGGLLGISGVALEIVDGGTLDQVSLTNLVIKNVRTAIFIRLGNRGRVFGPDIPKPGIGTLKNVQISNVQAELTDGAICSSITGEPGYSIENVSLSNLRLRFPGGGSRQAADIVVPELPGNYPDSIMYGPLPAYGFFCRYVKNLQFRDVIMEFAKPDHRPALVFHEVSDLDISGLRAATTAETPAVIRFNQVERAVIHNSFFTSTAPTFLQLRGDRTREVLLMGNDLRGFEHLTELEKGVPEDSVTLSGNLTRATTGLR